MELIAIGEWFVSRWRTRLADTGQDYHKVATQMRKAPTPFHITLWVLLGTKERFQHVAQEAQ